jgi:hypothetical protein
MKAIFTLLFFMIFASAEARINSFHWRQISGPVETIILHPDSATTVATGLYIPGKYKFELTVTNEVGEARDTVEITVTLEKVLAIVPEPPHIIRPPEVEKLEIKTIARAGDILIQIKSPRRQTISCGIYDVLGRVIGMTELKVEKGTNLMTVPKPTRPGFYIIRFISYFDNVTQKIII